MPENKRRQRVQENDSGSSNLSNASSGVIRIPSSVRDSITTAAILDGEAGPSGSRRAKPNRFMSGESVEVKLRESIREMNECRKRCFWFIKFIYNREEMTYCNRPLTRWVKLILFYAIFLGVLLAFTLFLFWIFSLLLDPHEPRLQLLKSNIGDNPGLTLFPIEVGKFDLSVINIKKSTPSNAMKWSNLIMMALEDYYESKPKKNCSFSSPPQKNEVCAVDVSLFGPCSINNFFGYLKNTPCVFLKLNRIFGWQPQFYNSTENLPESMPQSLKQHIANVSENERNSVWVSCSGVKAQDDEIIGNMKYYPELQGFPGYYYPYKNQKGYLSPLVAVQFENPKVNAFINIKCKLWARNIEHNRNAKTGENNFRLQIT